MRGSRETICKAADVMLAKGRDCLKLSLVESDSAIKLHDSALRQRMDADRINDGAKKLARLGHALEAEALDLRVGLEVSMADKPTVLLGALTS
jgi:hypothetical protein